MSKHLESLHQNLLNGKLPHNLSWSEAVELVGHLGQVQAHGDDEFVFTVGSQRAFFKKPHTHDLGAEEVSRLRKFLKDAGRGARPRQNRPSPAVRLSSLTTTPPMFTRTSVEVVRQTNTRCGLTILSISIII